MLTVDGVSLQNDADDRDDTIQQQPSAEEMALTPFVLAMFPNPTTGSVNIQADGVATTAHLLLYDLTGCEVWSQSLDGDGVEKSFQVALETLGLKSGVYIMTLRTSNNLVSKRLIFSASN
jgi:hypothetical protein